MNDHFYINKISEYSSNELLSLNLYRPRLSLTKKFRGYLSRFLGRSGGTPDYGFFWTTAILVIGLERVYEKSRDEKIKEVICHFFDENFNKKDPVKTPVCLDVVMYGYTLIYLNSLEKNYIYQKSIVKLAEYLLTEHVKTPRGILPYRVQNKNLVFIDAIGMVCPFLARYGKEFQNSDSTRLAINQIEDFFKYGMDADSGLPYHAYDSEAETKIGIIGWGRGIGWILFGCVDALEFIPKTYNGYESILLNFRSLVDKVVQYQDDLGYLKWHVIDKSAHIDTSATAMFGYAIARGVSIGILDFQYLEIAQKSLNALKYSTSLDGCVYDCSGECMGVGKYSQEFGAYPWSQGPATGLAAILEYQY